MIPAEKRCPKCGITKESSDFYVNRKRNCLVTYCKPCSAVAQAYWQRNNKEKVRAITIKRRSRSASQRRFKLYGIDDDQFKRMLDDQDHGCAICGLPETSKSSSGMIREIAVDHCHATGIVRGLLCSDCNNGLGHFKDDISRLESAILYLLKERAASACQAENLPDDELLA